MTKKRKEIRLNDVPEAIFDFVGKEAKENLRTKGKQVILMLTDYITKTKKQK